MVEIISSEIFILIGCGFVIGIFAVVIGGAMFFSVPLMQLLFPEVSFGVIIGNLKVGSFFRSVGSTFSTRRQIEYGRNIRLAVLAFVGTVGGASVIAHLNQTWLFPALVLAMVFALGAPKIAPYVTEKTFYIASFLTGIYAGFFGAGIGIMLIALLRLQYPDDTKIAFVKIQARFVEFLLIITAVITHFFHHNLIVTIWIPWAAGSVVGGYAGGVLLNKMGNLSGKVQKYILYGAFAFALLVAGLKAL